jgi:hypothetical protein
MREYTVEHDRLGEFSGFALIAEGPLPKPRYPNYLKLKAYLARVVAESSHVTDGFPFGRRAVVGVILLSRVPPSGPPSGGRVPPGKRRPPRAKKPRKKVSRR